MPYNCSLMNIDLCSVWWNKKHFKHKLILEGVQREISEV